MYVRQHSSELILRKSDYLWQPTRSKCRSRSSRLGIPSLAKHWLSQFVQCHTSNVATTIMIRSCYWVVFQHWSNFNECI